MSQALATHITQSYEPPAAMPPAPRQIARFEVRSEIGRGSNGVVYAAYDPVLGREVAIKALPLAGDSLVRRRVENNFLQEAKVLARLSHPAIVTVYDAGKTESIAYIAMERLYGGDLHDWLSSRNRLAPRAIASMMARVANAVHYAHQQGLIHRDLKPSNIFLTRDGKPKVLDFGVALAQASDAPNLKRQLIGTPNYMSPEQTHGRNPDARSDVFSMGAILYELLTGQRAFDGNQVEEILNKVATHPPTPIFQLNPEVPSELIEIVHRAMAKDASDRYQTAAEMRNDLLAAAREDFGRRPTLQPVPSVPLNRLRARWAIVAAVLAVSILILALEQQRGPVLPPQSTPTLAADSDSEEQAPATAPVAAKTAGGAESAHPAPTVRERPVAVLPALLPTHNRQSKPRAAPVAIAVAAPAPPPPADASVTLGISPWGEIVVDGASRGVSPPLTHLTLAPGAHTIEVRNGSAPPYVSRIDLQPAQAVELQHRF
ncbi:MAG: serine/threonine protein kinase [Burkholderiaceae bacterium]|nr:serine/threonine protein kinase [Burkholderiaceae bacterium]